MGGRQRLVLGTIILAMAASPGPAAAQPAPAAEAACPADAAPLPPELAGWTARTPLAAAADVPGLAGARLTIGGAVDLSLLPTPRLHYALRPENPGGSVSNGGMASFAVEREGRYRVAISSAAWIDVVRDGAVVASVVHGRGPACSGIRKMVDFTLQPGDYVLQIAGSGSPAISVLVARLP